MLPTFEPIEPYQLMGHPKVVEEQIGWLTLHEPTDFRNQYETACNFDTVRVPAGRYPVMGQVNDRGEVRNRQGYADDVIVRMRGVIVDGYVLNRLFWATSAEVGKNNGRESQHNLHLYGYALANIILGRSKPYVGEWELLPGFEARVIDFTYTDADGVDHERQTTGLYRRSA